MLVGVRTTRVVRRAGGRNERLQLWVQVMAQLKGEQELPWEGERFRTHPTDRRRLGVFRQQVLALLDRQPERRATMAEFCDSCHGLFISAQPCSFLTQVLLWQCRPRPCIVDVLEMPALRPSRPVCRDAILNT